MARRGLRRQVDSDPHSDRHSVLTNDAEPVGAFEEPGDLNSTAGLSMASDSLSGEASIRDPQATPAWRRIEEYREMRELNSRLRDEVYGAHPVSSLWDDEGP
jgi:hypothetical protein